jgi:hypothetical protein
MSINLSYRMFKEEDLPQLLRLWEEETHWGAITGEDWRRRYMESPYGPSLTSVAVNDNDEVVGQMIFTPSRVAVDKREVSALRQSAPILRKDQRRVRLRSLDHPVVGMYFAGIGRAAATGYELLYALPEHAWLPFFRWTSRYDSTPPFATVEYKCCRLGFSSSAAVEEPASRLRCRPVDEFSSEYDALWTLAREDMPIRCGVVRSSVWLAFRYPEEKFLRLEVRDPEGNELVGYVIIAHKKALICDVLARNSGDIHPVLAAVVSWFSVQQRDGELTQWAGLQAMETPAIAMALRDLGFEPVDYYRFAFVCKTLDPSLPAAALAPEQWYVSPGD